MHYFLRNNRLNAKINHFSIRLHALGQATQAQLPSFTFMSLSQEYTRVRAQAKRTKPAQVGSTQLGSSMQKCVGKHKREFHTEYK